MADNLVTDTLRSDDQEDTVDADGLLLYQCPRRHDGPLVISSLRLHRHRRHLPLKIAL